MRQRLAPAIALWTGQRGPWGAASAQAAKLPGAAASAPLDFRANEVIHPALAQLSDLIEFSGPLVAPNTAVLRAKTSGTLLQAERGHASNERLAAAQASLATTTVAQRDALLSAPTAGIVAKRHVLPGEPATPASLKPGTQPAGA